MSWIVPTYLSELSVRIEHHLREVVEVLDRAVAEYDLVFDVERRLACVHAHERLGDPLPVRGVYPAVEELLAVDGGIVRLHLEDAPQLGRVVIRRAAADVHHVVAEVGEFLRQAQLRLAAAQLLLGLLARGDVANEAHEARRLDPQHPPDGEVAGEDAAVLASRADLAADADDALLAGGHVAVHVAVVLPAEGFGHQLAHVAPEDLLALVAEGALRGPAEFLDRAVVVHDDDGIHRGVEDGPVLQALLAGGGVARCAAADCRCVLARHPAGRPGSKPPMLSEPAVQD